MTLVESLGSSLPVVLMVFGVLVLSLAAAILAILADY
jgi:hypothetical protein